MFNWFQLYTRLQMLWRSMLKILWFVKDTIWMSKRSILSQVKFHIDLKTRLKILLRPKAPQRLKKTPIALNSSNMSFSRAFSEILPSIAQASPRQFFIGFINSLLIPYWFPIDFRASNTLSMLKKLIFPSLHPLTIQWNRGTTAKLAGAPRNKFIWYSLKLLGKISFVMRHVLRILIATTKRFASMENASLDVQVTTIALKD